ncbi:hypothetical protein LINGRAPRIM_LOCUS2827 [Linum grandiflorum]
MGNSSGPSVGCLSVLWKVDGYFSESTTSLISAG